MASHLGPNIIEEGLVVGYDTGYPLVGTSRDVFKFNKGKPTTNLLTQTGAQSLDVRTDIYNNTTKTDLGGGKFKFVNDGTGGSTIRLYTNVNDLTDNAIYGCSVNYENFNPGVGTAVILDWCDINNTAFSVANFGSSNRVFMSGSRSEYNSTYRFLDISVPISSSITLFNAQVELGVPSPFTDDIRSVSGSLIDLKRSKDINVSNVSFNSNAQIAFDGTNDSIEIADSNDLDLTSNLSFEFIVKADSSQSNPYPRLLDKSVYLVHLSVSSPFSIAQNISTSDGLRQVNVGSAFPSDKWTHIITSYDGQNGRIYVNGSLVATNSWSTTLPCNTNSATLKIGGDGGTNRPLNGELPIAKIYNKVLTAEEVLNSFNSLRHRFEL